MSRLSKRQGAYAGEKYGGGDTKNGTTGGWLGRGVGMHNPIPIYLLWFSPAMLRGDPTLKLDGLLGCVILRGPCHFRARLLLRKRPGTQDETTGTWADVWETPIGEPFDAGEA